MSGQNQDRATDAPAPPGPPTSRERVGLAARGVEVDRCPIAFWQHFPDADQSPHGLIEATLKYQEGYRLDLVKLMPSGMYSVTDYGAVAGPPDPISGARALAKSPVKSLSEIASLPPILAEEGSLSAQLGVAREVRRATDPGVPVLDTLFSPLTMAVKLFGLPAREMVESHPAELHQALGRLAADCAAFAREDLRGGIDGFFFAVQWAGAGELTDQQQQQYGVAYDQQVIAEIREGSDLLMLHLHGPNPNFELSERYQVDWVNWEDVETPPSLPEALGLTTRGLAGGITREPDRLSGSPDRALAILDAAMAATRGRRLLLAPGCVLPQTASAEVLSALRNRVGETRPFLDGGV